MAMSSIALATHQPKTDPARNGSRYSTFAVSRLRSASAVRGTAGSACMPAPDGTGRRHFPATAGPCWASSCAGSNNRGSEQSDSDRGLEPVRGPRRRSSKLIQRLRQTRWEASDETLSALLDVSAFGGTDWQSVL